jgi:penicillin amidase
LVFLSALLTFGFTAAQENELIIPGLHSRVEILRDEWGIAHIYADNSHDLFFAQGYTHAQDRWWQMEWWRHLGNGRLSELAGDSLLGTDIFIRTLGGHAVVRRELAEGYNAEVEPYLQAFAGGVNAYLNDRQPGQLAMQYTALGIAGIQTKIEPWTPADTLIWAKVMAFNLGGNMGIEMLLSELSAQLPQEMIDQFAPAFPYGYHPTILTSEDLPITDESLKTSPLAAITAMTGIKGLQTRLAGSVSPEIDLGLGRELGIGSNNWVVSGTLTESGLPLLANDPHLSIQMPSIWYEIGLHCQPLSDECPFNVTGFTFSPSPGVVIGHNDDIAWGMTNTIADVQDLYQIRVNPDNPLQYEWNGEWRDITLREEMIETGGTPSITIQVRETHLGPIINDNALENGRPSGFNNDNPLALRWTALEPGTLFRAVLRLNQARSWEEFREALRYWDAPSQNIVYADRQGNIGYQMPGSSPIRAGDHTGLLPVPGWTDAYEWRGYIPFDSLPRILNPERGYIVTANQAIVPLDYYDQLAAQLGDQFGADTNYHIGYYFAYGYRGQRINDLIVELAPHTPKTFATIQSDNLNLSAQEMLPYITALEFDDPLLDEARDWLSEWDFQMHMDSQQAALYAYFWLHLMDNLFNDQLAPVLRATGGDNYLWATYQLAQNPQSIWWDDTRTPEIIETRDDILKRSFAEAYTAAVQKLGEDRGAWRWGDLHTATFVSDPLGQSGIPLVEAIVNRGPVATSGGSEIVNATGWSAASGSFEVNSLPSMRMIVDLGDMDSSLAIHTTGQSGNPFSPHYSDMIDLWRNIEYHPMLWKREQVEAAAVNTLVLRPER